MGKTTQQVIDKQIRNALNATQDFKDGVENCDVDPIKAALAKNAKRVKKLQESITKKTWERTMEKLSKKDWQEPTIAKADRYGPGVEAARPKIEKFVTGFRPHLDEVRKAVNAMPDETEAQRDAKAVEMMKRLRDKKGKWR